VRRYNGAMNASTDIDYARYDHIRPILWTGDTLQLLDQRKLPFVVEHVECRDSDAVAEAIHALTVRGAPAIGIAAAYGLVLGARVPIMITSRADPLEARLASCALASIFIDHQRGRLHERAS